MAKSVLFFLIFSALFSVTQTSKASALDSVDYEWEALELIDKGESNKDTARSPEALACIDQCMKRYKVCKIKNQNRCEEKLTWCSDWCRARAD